MIRIIGISGSLRKGSYNTALLKTAKEMMPNGAELKIVAIDEVPLFNEDVEKLGAPAIVNSLKDQIAAADHYASGV